MSSTTSTLDTIFSEMRAFLLRLQHMRRVEAENQQDFGRRRLMPSPRMVSLLAPDPASTLRRRKKNPLSPVKEDSTDLQPFQCDSCEERFSTMFSWEAHRKRLHPEILQFHCTICNEGFQNSQLFVTHTGMHTIRRKANQVKREASKDDDDNEN